MNTSLRGPVGPYSLALYSLTLYSIERNSRTVYKLHMRWAKSHTAWLWRCYHKTWKYMVLDNALRRIQTIVDTYGKPKTLDIMGYLAQYEPPG